MVVAFISNQEELRKLVEQEPLIARGPSLEGTVELNLSTSLFFGVGICNGGNHPMLSQGLPIDVLSMILMSEKLSEDKHVLIADTHARTNGFSELDVKRTSTSYIETVSKVVSNLGLTGWNFLLGSELENSKEYRGILQEINEPNGYVRRQLADMAWFNRRENAGLKLGWALNGTRNTDETAFDRRFVEEFGNVMSFIYLVSGRTFDPEKIRAPPYFCGDQEARLLLRKDEDVKRKIDIAKERFGDQGINNYKNFLKPLVRLYNNVVERIEGHMEERLQRIIDRCLG